MKNRVHLLLVSIALFGSTAGIMTAEAAQQEEQYASILDLYADAARFNWERQEYIDHGLCYIYGYNPSSMGYCFTDINSDGVDEMLTGVYADKSPMEPKYGNIYEIYTLSEGVPVRLAEGNERNRYSICEDGTVCYFWTGGAATNGWSYYTLPADSTELSQYLMIGTDAVYYETDNPDACSFKNTTPPFDYSGNEMITYDEVNSIADSYTYQVPSFLSILDYEKKMLRHLTFLTWIRNMGSHSTETLSICILLRRRTNGHHSSIRRMGSPLFMEHTTCRWAIVSLT